MKKNYSGIILNAYFFFKQKLCCIIIGITFLFVKYEPINPKKAFNILRCQIIIISNRGSCELRTLYANIIYFINNS